MQLLGLMLLACGIDQGLGTIGPDADAGPRPPRDQAESEETSPAEDQAEEEAAPSEEDQEEPDQTGEDEEEEPDSGGGPSGAQPPQPGDLVISELMIDPAAVDDKVGEWVELANHSSHAVSLEGLWLMDEGVDGIEILGISEIAAGGHVVLCASQNLTENGGLDCDGEYLYQGFGGGLALSNTEDELILIDAEGEELDRFLWHEGFAVVGASMGVDPSFQTKNGNDAEAHWCAQEGQLPAGDEGTPGRENTGC